MEIMERMGHQQFCISIRFVLLLIRLWAVIQTFHHVMAGKATVHGFEYEDDDVEASAATGIDDGDDEHITVSLEMVVQHTTVSLGVVEHIAVHICMKIPF